MQTAIIGIGGRGGIIGAINEGSGPNTKLKELIEQGVRQGSTKMMKVKQDGMVEPSNGLNTIGTGVMVNIQA
jgi:hypothetical protein